MSEIADPETAPEHAEPAGVRKLVYSDLPAVLSIERRAFVTPWSLAMFVLELSKPSGICLAARDESRMVGYLVCSSYGEVWHLMNIAVEPDRRRAGIATTLVRRLFDEVGSGARIMLEVRASNLGAIAMYRRFGFATAGHRRRYYQDNGEDALVMERVI